jgi:YaiO family outer membrane protein
MAMLTRRLEERPSDSDARVLLGVVLSWEGRYDEARKHLKQVVAERPGHGDAVPALINVELWSGRADEAERLAAEALRPDPLNSGLLLARARALRDLGRKREAEAVLERLLDEEPRHGQARSLLAQLQEGRRAFEAAFSYGAEWFSDGRTPWHEGSLQIRGRTPLGSWITRFSQANRFEINSRQAEVDLYPRFRKGTYAYLNAGFSPDHDLYPSYRLGGDLYQSLSRGWEGTGGYRRLGFGSGVNIFTAALSKYYGDWLFTGRVFLTPDNIGTSRSVHFSFRRYFGDATGYWGLRIGKGASLEARSATDIAVLDSVTTQGEFQRGFGRRWTLLVRGGFSREDRIARSGLGHYSFDATGYFRF